MNGIRVTLDAGERFTANTMAAFRQAANRGAGVTNRLHGDRNAYDSELLGATAELAFCKHFNCWPDLTTVLRAGGHDAVLNSRTYDIKAIGKPDHRLLAPVSKRLEDADRYVLALVDGGTVTLLGWAPAGQLLNPLTIVDLGHGPVHALAQDQLQPFPEVAQ